MQKLKFLIFAFVISVCVIGGVNAEACDNAKKAELNSLVSNISVSYEEETGVLDRSEYEIPDALIGTPEAETFVGTYTYFEITVLNITDDVYVEVTDDYTGEKKVYQYGDTDNGILRIEWKNIGNVATFTFKVFASSKSECEGDRLRTLYLTVPRLNEYYGYDICDDAEGFYLCEKYTTSTTDVGFYDFLDRVEAYIAGEVDKDGDAIDEDEDKGVFQSILDFVSENKVYFIVGIVVIIVVGGLSYVVIKKRRSEDI